MQYNDLLEKLIVFCQKITSMLQHASSRVITLFLDFVQHSVFRSNAWKWGLTVEFWLKYYIVIVTISCFCIEISNSKTIQLESKAHFHFHPFPWITVFSIFTLSKYITVCLLNMHIMLYVKSVGSIYINIFRSVDLWIFHCLSFFICSASGNGDCSSLALSSAHLWCFLLIF